MDGGDYVLKIAGGADLHGRYDWLASGPGWCAASSAPTAQQAIAEAADMLLHRLASIEEPHLPARLRRASPAAT